jgi:UDP-glucose 4-epimerase
MRAVVTGGAGFVGSHLVEHLLGRGWDVTVLDDMSTGEEANLQKVLPDPRLRVVRGSVCDPRAVDDSFERSDSAFHLAAAVGTFTIRDDPIRSLVTNVHGTENVLEAARRHGTRVLVASTSEIYGMNPKIGLTEDDLRIIGSPTQSRWSYSDAKAIDETLTRAYFLEHGVPSVIVRLFNTVGPRQTGHYGMVIPRFVAQALSSRPLTVYGSGKQTRCFCHISDVVSALVALLETPEAHGQVFNLGGSEPVDIESLARRIIVASGSISDIVYVPYAEAHYPGYQDVERRVPDCGRARAVVGFMPTRSLGEIIEDVIQYQREASGTTTEEAGVVTARRSVGHER